MKNIHELIDKRKRWVRSNKENEFEIDNILAGLYNDPSHFIYEIIQNAEDAGANEISFTLEPDKLIIFHNGHDFDFDDVNGITGIGISTKKDSINKIGKFGVGFKSVFAISQNPQIHSGRYHFQIDDFVVPIIVESLNNSGTKILLPFNHPSRSKEEIYNLIQTKLKNIGLKTLLFLSNINEIKWHTIDESGHYYKESEKIFGYSNVHRTSVISVVDGKEYFEEFLVIFRRIVLEQKTLKVEVGYRIEEDDDGQEIIVPEKDSKLIVFFPTEKITFLNFLIQGPYKTTPNREGIPLDDEQNAFIIEETAKLVAESISIVKQLGLLNAQFLEVLPIKSEHLDNLIYSKIYHRIKDEFLSEKSLLPTSIDSFSPANQTVLARGRELTEFLKTKDIEMLFEKKQWLDTAITYDRTRDLRDYLVHELGVNEINFESFAEKVSAEFFETKKDDWMIDFYGRLLGQNALWRKGSNYKKAGILRRKPIIRTSNNNHIAPFDVNDKVQVYLPTKTKTEYNTLKETLVQEENALQFFKELGLREPDLLAEIQEHVMPKYQNLTDNTEVELAEYLNDLEKILIAYRNVNNLSQNRLFSEIKELRIIRSVEYESSKIFFKAPEEVYMRDQKLLEYFNGSEGIYFVAKELYEHFDSNELNPFLLDLGCSEHPKRIRIEGNLSWEQKKELRGDTGCTRDRHIYDYNYDGIEHIFNSITLSRSTLLWELLLLSLSNLKRYEISSFFMGEYEWKYYTVYSKKFPSRFLIKLKEAAWLVDKDYKFRKPGDLTVSELADGYDKTDDNINEFTRILGFQLDEIKQLEEKTGGKFIPPEEVSEYEKWKSEQSVSDDHTTEDKIWSPEIYPDATEPKSEEIEPGDILLPDYSGQEPKDTNNGSEDEHYNGAENENKDDSIVTNPKSKKKIGQWGEQYVLKDLENKYKNKSEIEIVWLNKSGDGGKGCDFIIKSNGIEIEYIEVKSKINKDKAFFNVTGPQFEFARRLFNEGNGHRYKLFVVNEAGTERAKISIIKNPIKLWKEGKLYAHPVRFKL